MKTWVLLAVLFAPPLVAQQPATNPNPDAMMDMYNDLARPVAAHARLEALAGKWAVTVRLWFDPKGEPISAAGTGTGRMILGGRFLQLDADLQGKYAMQSLTVIGYDRRFSEYTLVAYDTMGTYHITAAGKYDPAAKHLLLEGSYAMPPTNEQQKYRFVWTSSSKDAHLLRLDFLSEGNWVRVAETELRRAK